MGYSKNPDLLARDVEIFAQLAAGKACRWKTSRDWLSTEKLLRRLRQGLYIASTYPDKFPALCEAARNFSLHVVEPGLIEARPKLTARVETDTSARTSTMHGPTQGPEVPEVGLTTAGELIDSWIRHLPSSDPIDFKQTTLSDTELSILYRWAKNSAFPERAVLVGKGFITLSLMEPGLSAVEWQPATSPQPITKERIYDIDPD